MTETRDEATGQFASAEEPRFGKEALEHDAGFAPMPQYVEEPAEPEEFATPREAAEVLAGQEEPAVPVVYFDSKTGERLNGDVEAGPVETITPERAAADLTAYRNANVDNAAKSISNDFAAAIDARRAEATKDNPELAKELGIDPPAKGEKPAEGNTLTGEQAAGPDPIDSVEGLAEETKQALKIPQIREAIEAHLGQAEQTRQAYATGLANAHAFGQASFFAALPELAGLPPEQLENGLALLAQVDPPRFQHAMNVLNNVSQIQAAQQRDQQQRAYAAHQQFEAQRREYSTQADEALGPMTRAEKSEMVEELVNYVGEHGVTRDQFVQEASTNLALHHPAFQKMAADAIKYQRLMKAPKAISTRALPPVQRPGPAAPRRSGRESDLQSLQRDFESASGDRQLKAAAKIIEARRRS